MRAKLVRIGNSRGLRLAKPLLLAGGLPLAVPPARADGEPAGVTVRTLVQSTQAWNGTPLPAYPSGQPEVTVLRITIPPGVKLPMHQLLVTSASGASLQLKAGQGLIEMVNQPHFGTNNGSEAAEIVEVYAGGRPIPLMVGGERRCPAVSGAWMGHLDGCDLARSRSVQAVQRPSPPR
ncbi:cupin domain-containing protein [Synechococcus sp. CS-1332]|uniref:cupin domain-containing protein n=1 Tax=Synechococcus sp. CS-1332 TaxID=2847972 RepID=UPI00223BA96B|nr:cupin domain-containing protein [Synechococcus sp. CS-1332]MCT0207459.1 cupin domain-containing protein [Synechococcus sp. CS-1332]